MAINAEWHAKNGMPKRATMNQCIRWHEEHARECGCRPIPPTVWSAMAKKNTRR